MTVLERAPEHDPPHIVTHASAPDARFRATCRDTAIMAGTRLATRGALDWRNKMPTMMNRSTGLIRSLRDRLRRSKPAHQRQQREPSELARRGGDYPAIGDRDPLRMMGEMMRFDPFRAGGLVPGFEGTWSPSFEVRDNGTAVRFIADLPGVRREDLDIAVAGRRLTISGRRDTEDRGSDEIVYEYRPYGQFTRSFTLPDNVDLEHITSDLRDGVLYVVVPKTTGARARKIAIGGSNPKS